MPERGNSIQNYELFIEEDIDPETLKKLIIYIEKINVQISANHARI